MATAENIWAWSTTAAGNDVADSAIGWAEGQDPGTVNNSARSMMAATAKWADVLSGNVGVALTGGNANAIEITTNQSISSGHQALGFRVCFKATAANTGATTVAVDGLSAVAINRPDGTALTAGDLSTGGFYDIAFDGTNYKLLGAVPAAGSYGLLSGGNTWTGTNLYSNNSVSYPFITTTTNFGTIPFLVQNATVGHPINDLYLIEFANAGGSCGSIQTNSSLPSMVVNETSDHRLKDNVRDLDDAGPVIDAMRPRKFNWKADPSRTFTGFVAHELQDVVPDAVSGEKDAVKGDGKIQPQGVALSRLVPYLVAEIKALRARVAALEAAS